MINKMGPNARFTETQLATLRAGFGAFERMPLRKADELMDLLDGCCDGAMLQLAQANIRFVSVLAANRVYRATGVFPARHPAPKT